MLKTKFAPLLVVALLVCLSSVVRAQRPGFYSGSLPGGGSSREPAGPRGDRGPMQHALQLAASARWCGLLLWCGAGILSAAVLRYPYYYPRWGYGYGTGIYFDPATNTAEYYLPPIYCAGRTELRSAGSRSDSWEFAAIRWSCPRRRTWCRMRRTKT